MTKVRKSAWRPGPDWIASCGTAIGEAASYLSTASMQKRGAVVHYEVYFTARTVAYYGCNEEDYLEAHPAVEVDS
jgi:hypothetical protein